MQTLIAPGAADTVAVRRAAGLLHDRFMQQARRRPEATALVHDRQAWSYRALDERSNQLAHVLRARGAGAGSLVGICLERSVDLVVSLLAVLKTGSAYVPLDPAYPRDRIAFMLQDSAAPLVLSRSGLLTGAAAAATFDLDLERATVDASSTRPLPSPEASADLACVLYTSGSTGRPKGVMLRHTATAMIDWATALFPDGELDRVAATTSICFDPSIFEIFAPLSVGGTIILKDNLLSRFDPEERPSLLNGVPSAFAELAKAQRIPDTVRVINVGGERLSAGLAREIYRNSHVGQVWNHYGPTEATICASVALVARDAEQDPPIGQAIAGARLYVLDEAGDPVGPEAVGELFIGGPSLAAGYLNRPELTAECFLPDPFEGAGSRMYRTGDLVRRSRLGDLVFVARKGRQVKFRGFRIELDEIESALRRLPRVMDAAMVATVRDTVADGLVAVVSSHEVMTLPAVRRALGMTLPTYMLPTRLLVLPALPLTLSGKVDLQAVAALAAIEPVMDEVPERVDLPLLQEVVLGVFRDVLRQPPLSQHDDFFEQGGDSLAAAEAAAQLEALLGHPVPPALLHHGRTAATLAPLLSREARTPDHLTTLQPSGSKNPLFCLPDVFGRPLSVISLARRFRGDRPVHGLSPGQLEDDTLADPRLSRLTAAYMAEIKTVRPDGRYLLVGYSAAAIPAIDLACALQDAGDEVVLILIDPRAQRIAINIKDRVSRYLRTALTLRGTARAAAASHRHQVPGWVPKGYVELTEALLQAEADWQPRIFLGTTLLAQCRLSGRLEGVIARLWRGFSPAMARTWGAFLQGGLTVATFEASHDEIMREPTVRQLSDWMKQRLEVMERAE